MNLIQIKYGTIPFRIRTFIKKALAIGIFWKVFYIFFLMPGRWIDEPLSSHVGKNTTYLLNHFSGMQQFKSINTVDTTFMEGQMQLSPVCKILHYNKKVLHIADGCNGLELMMIYLGFLVCFPAEIILKIKYGISGLICIDLMNILRCYCLGFLKEYYHPLFYISHHFIFKAIIYSVIIFLWMGFANKNQLINEKSSTIIDTIS